MRTKRFVAVHRGGTLTKEHHRQLIRWARECSEHVLSLIDGPVDKRLVHALRVAKEWENGNATTGDSMKASLGAHAAAREASDTVVTAVARSAGQVVATAHMADHSLGTALYALKAVKHAGKSVEEEREWQNEQLRSRFKAGPPEIVELVLITMMEKEKGLKI
jgi:hypothetical protein